MSFSLSDTAAKLVSYLLYPLEQPRQALSLYKTALFKRPLFHELLVIKPYQKWLQQAGIQTVIDVGAYVGSFAFAIRHFLPEAQIYSFEPQPECYQQLVRNMAGDPRFLGFNLALGDQQGEITFWKSEFSPSSSVLPMSDLHKDAFPHTANSEPIQVEAQPLDAFLNRLTLEPKVLLKIDVQGFEANVIRSATETLRKVDYVWMEVSYRQLYQGQMLFGDIYELMRSQGFELIGNLEPLISPVDGSFLQSDAVFARR